MYIKQLYTNCLAEAAYYIESNGEALIIDPIREPEPYLELAAVRGATIKYVLETHFHADFVSGHQELARKTGATICYGPTATPDYDAKVFYDGEEIELGNLSITAIHTPGHTPESTCYLLKDEEGKDYAIFTGDTLFVGDVGRPDLLDGVIISKEEQLESLYHTLNHKIKTLADDIIVYPGHGPGSMCGKSIGTETESTIGKEKRTNYALQDMDFETFAKTILDGQLAAPAYFVQNAIINRKGYQPVEDLMDKASRRLSPEQAWSEVQNKGVQILDCREGNHFLNNFIDGAIQVGLDGSFAIWVGTVVDIHQPLVIIAPEGREKEAIKRLARIGFENIVGYLPEDVKAWQKAGLPIVSIPNLESADAAEYLSKYKILDVRRQGEWNTAHVEDADLLPLRELQAKLDTLEKEQPLAVHCAGGYRSIIALSILKKEGFKNLANIRGGFTEMAKANTFPIVTEELV